MQMRLTDDSINTHARLLRRLQIPVIILLILAVLVVYSPVQTKLPDLQEESTNISLAENPNTNTVPVSVEKNDGRESLDSTESEFVIKNPTLQPQDTSLEPPLSNVADEKFDPTETTIESVSDVEDITSQVESVQATADSENVESPSDDPSESEVHSQQTLIGTHLYDQIDQVSEPLKTKMQLARELKTSMIREAWKSTKQATEWIKKAKPVVESPKQLVLRNAKSNKGSVAFLLDKEVKNLAPGEEFQIADETVHTVRFHRGGEFGQAKIEVHTGTYEFQVTDSGWDLAPQSDK